MSQKVLEKINSLQPEAVDLMKKLVAINSVGPKNDGPGEAEEAEFLEKYLRDIGFSDIKNYPAPDKNVAGGERPNLVALMPGKKQEKTLWIMAHTDVVPAGDLSKWHSDPFVAVEKDGKIIGRGSEDNQQGMVSGIIAARALLETGTAPACNLGLVLVADEETGSEFGLGYLLENHAGLFKADDLVLIPDAGEADGSMIEVAEKSILWLKIKTLGKQVHASMPHLGVNAFKAASRLVTDLEQLYEIFGSHNELFDPPTSTFEPTKKEANVPNVNTLPGDDVFYLDCRILPEFSIEEVEKQVRLMADAVEKKYNVKIEIGHEQREQAAPATAEDAPVVKMLDAVIRKVYDVEPRAMGIGGGTVAALFRRKGIPAAVWSKMEDMAHQPNEYCLVDNLVNDAKVMALCALYDPEE